jgi:ATP-dependent Clp protease adaptor protein ClpS
MTTMQAETGVLDQIAVEAQIERPKMYCVVLHNDDTTTFDFVIAVLIGIFHHTPETAVSITNDIHNMGDGVAGGPYTREIAEEKYMEVTLFSRANGFNLVASVDEA